MSLNLASEALSKSHHLYLFTPNPLFLFSIGIDNCTLSSLLLIVEYSKGLALTVNL